MRKSGEYVGTADEIYITPRAGLLARQASNTDLEAALQDVQRHFAVATVLFENVDDSGRSGAWHALNSAIEYFSSLGLPMAALQPLNAIAGAMVDASRGTASKLFTVENKNGRPPLSSLQTLFDQQVAAITDCCVQHYRNGGAKSYLEDGCREAARIMTSAGLGRSFSAKEVKERRQRVFGFAAHDPKRAIFDDLRNSDAVRADPLRCAILMATSDFLNALPPDPEL